MSWKINIFLFFMLYCMLTSAQVRDKKLIQFSGIVVTSDSSAPVPFASVIIKHIHKGVTSDFVGFFSMAVRRADTLEISAIGFKKGYLVIPDTLQKNALYSVITLDPDTILLKTVVVRPWPEIERFKQIFLQKKVPDDDLERAKRNLSKENMQMAYDNMPMDPHMNFRHSLQQRAEKLYYAGQYPPLRLLDPLAWARFIKALKNGDLKIENE
jgi:hypothetical protein